MNEESRGRGSLSLSNGLSSDTQNCVNEMRVRVTAALRLLEQEEKIGAGDKSLNGRPAAAGYAAGLEPTAPNTGAAGYPGSEASGSNDANRDSAVKELKAAAGLMGSLEELLAKQAAEAREHMAFETIIESAPECTRAWLQLEFSETSRNANRQNQAPDEDYEEMPMCGVRSTALSGFDISDEIVQAGLKSPEVKRYLSTAGSLEFDALAFDKLGDVSRRGIGILGVHLEAKQGLIKQMARDGSIDSSVATPKEFQSAYLSFLTMLDQLYNPDAIYHGAAHAMDVMSTSTWFMKSPVMLENSRPLHHFMVLVAAAVHDVGHPGVNNLFLTKTMDPIAIRYNDKSCLENMHVAITFELMQKDSLSNWFGMLNKTGPGSAQKNIREGIISMVLATDMSQHARYVSKLENILKARAGREEGAKVDQKIVDEEQTLLLDLIVHTSDISNPAKPRQNMLAWTKRVNMEFWAQGDQERDKGVDISPLCDRAAGRPALAKGQIGFINFVVMPFFTTITQIIPEAQEAVDALQETLSFWKETDAAGTLLEVFFDGIDPQLEC